MSKKGCERTSSLEMRELAQNGLRKCTQCKEIKSMDDFHKSNNNPHGRTALCKYCCKINKKANWLYDRKSHLKNNYGLTLEDLYSMLEIQDYKCAICKEDINEKSNVDHDHLTGKIRGVLCPMCNKGLGHFKDNPQFLLSAIGYLTKN